MGILSLPSTLDNFEGHVSHIAAAGSSETLVFVSPLGSSRHKSELSTRLKGMTDSLVAVASPSTPKQGEAYIAKVGGLLERAHIIRRPMPATFQIYLIDQGVQSEVEYTNLFEYPEELLDLGVFACMCPVLVPSDELVFYDSIIARKCLCSVEGVAKSVVVFGFVKGKLSVENDSGFAELTRNKSGGRSLDSLDSSTFDAKSVSTTSDSFNESELMCSSNDLVSEDSDRVWTRSGGEVRNENNILGKFLHYRGVGPNTSNRNKQLGAFFKQTAFKEFMPEEMPQIIASRFDKMDRLYSTFWVVNGKTFSAVERALKTSMERLPYLPNLTVTEDEALAKSIPCVVRTRTDSPFRDFHRAVPIRFDRSSRRFSIFLVDFGWFKWVVASDVFDISSLNESDPIRSLPVALIHCREDEGGSLHAKALAKGRVCKMVIKERDLKNIFTVSLYDSSENPSLPVAEEKTEKVPTTTTSVADLSDITSCRKLINDVCVQQLKVSLMMETLSTCPTNYHQTWMAPSVYPNHPVIPTYMPFVPVPFIMPVRYGNAAPNKDVQQQENRTEEKSQKSPTEEKSFQNDYRALDPKKSWDVDDSIFTASPGKRREPGLSPNQKTNQFNSWNSDKNFNRLRRGSFGRGGRLRTDVRRDDRFFSEEDRRPTWEQAVRRGQDQRRGGRRGWLGGAQRSGPTAWELVRPFEVIPCKGAVAADRESRRKATMDSSEVFASAK